MTDSTPSRPPQMSLTKRLYRAIYNLKIRQVIIILLATSGVLYILDYVGSLPNIPAFFTIFTRPPFPAFADAFLTSAIVGFTFELLVRSEAEAELRDTLNEILSQQTIAVLEGIPRALMLRKEVQRELIKGSKLEEIILNALQSRLSDDQMGEGIYNGLIRKAITYEERWSNYRYEIFVENITDPNVPEQIRREFFDVIMRITYDTNLRKTRFAFTCAATQDQFNELMRNPDYEVRWMMPPSEVFKVADEMSFQVLQMSVDETPLPIVSDKKPDGRFEIVCEDPSLANKIGQKVTVSYTFKVKAEKVGHAISTTVIYPTYDVTIEFNFAKAAIDYVEVFDYFVSARRPAIRYIPDTENPYKITVQLKEWAFPKGGAIFVWILKEEMDYVRERREQLS
jgi:hypothetical protein